MSTCSKSTEQIRIVPLIASETSSRIICSPSVSVKGKVGNESFPRTHSRGKKNKNKKNRQVGRDNSRRVLTTRGGGTAIYGLYRYVSL